MDCLFTTWRSTINNVHCISLLKYRIQRSCSLFFFISYLFICIKYLFCWHLITCKTYSCIFFFLSYGLVFLRYIVLSSKKQFLTVIEKVEREVNS
ncbi:hypothetical protein BDF20DRAFT_886265 [Mycotypha africana]|uniref:uncharacterized protein n=1 Tax=Mycotypha africana TaxID=64632 RepID=UPI00230019DF|nr:uncharacterized protein BDF20DRAFT_886265 [Mycotypha africana]KAI8971748.1 hypothetical protein BDF20DRAFT_886265 [Mycotypha africana]